jgi:hypothetical protein
MIEVGINPSPSFPARCWCPNWTGSLALSVLLPFFYILKQKTTLDSITLEPCYGQENPSSARSITRWGVMTCEAAPGSRIHVGGVDILKEQTVTPRCDRDWFSEMLFAQPLVNCAHDISCNFYFSSGVAEMCSLLVLFGLFELTSAFSHVSSSLRISIKQSGIWNPIIRMWCVSYTGL